ncbi:ABC transporter permease [bacterium SCSIO 12741]|nr:ABC transporter permease [bacterium SCSIO 12741]
MILARLAWRNLWRNRRRTLITISSIAFAVVIAVVMRGFQLGTYDSMIEGTLRTSSGHVQIQHKDFFDDASIEHIFDYTPELQKLTAVNPAIQNQFPRFENFALASFESHTKGVPVVGMKPELEVDALAIQDKLTQGEYLEPGEDGLLISEDLARFLQVALGDSMVLFGQGYHGVTAVGKYPIKGIYDFNYSGQGGGPVFLNLEQAQDLYGAYGMLSSLSLILNNKEESEELQKELLTEFEGSPITALTWKKLNENLLQSIELDSVSGLIMIGVLYLVIGFGIFGTLLMMAAERRREFSVMNSMGMQRRHIVQLVAIETLWLALISVIVGVLISLPINAYFWYNPIEFSGETAEMFSEYNVEPVMRMSMELGYLIDQALVVFLLSTVSLIAPLSLILNLNIVNALRGR